MRCLSNLVARPVLLRQPGVAHQTSLRSLATMMAYSNSPRLDSGTQVANSFGRSLHRRTIVRIRHSCTGTTAYLSQLSTVTELFIVDRVAHHGPEPDPEFAHCRDSRFALSFLYWFASIEAFQLRVSFDCVHGRSRVLLPLLKLLASSIRPYGAGAGVCKVSQ